jgi:predicted transcriptional regulator
VSPLSVPSVEDIRKLRKRLHLTQSELARLAGVSQSLVSQIESGEVDPRLSTLKRIVEALNRQESEGEVFAEDIFVKDVICVGPDDAVTDAANGMWSNFISQLPVIENDKNVGSISEKSITAEIAKGSGKEMARKKIKDVMQDPFPMVGRRTSIDVVISLLQENLAVLVTEGGRVGGIITKADVLPRLGARIRRGDQNSIASSR